MRCLKKTVKITRSNRKQISPTCERLFARRFKVDLSRVAVASRANRFRSSFSKRACWRAERQKNSVIRFNAVMLTWKARRNFTKIEKKFVGLWLRAVSPWTTNNRHSDRVSLQLLTEVLHALIERVLREFRIFAQPIDFRLSDAKKIF